MALSSEQEREFDQAADRARGGMGGALGDLERARPVQLDGPVGRPRRLRPTLSDHAARRSPQVGQEGARHGLMGVYHG